MRRRLLTGIKKFIILHHSRAQHIYQVIFKTTEGGENKITEDGIEKITENSDY